MLDPGLGSIKVRLGLAVWMAKQERADWGWPAMPPLSNWGCSNASLDQQRAQRKPSLELS